MARSGEGEVTQQRPDLRFRPTQRLRKAADFETVFRTAQRSADGYFTVLYRTSGLDNARLGLAIPAKKVRTAVARNRLRRLIRESFRHHQSELTGFDIVVLPRDAAVAAANAQLAESLAGHWQRVGRNAVRR